MYIYTYVHTYVHSNTYTMLGYLTCYVNNAHAHLYMHVCACVCNITVVRMSHVCLRVCVRAESHSHSACDLLYMRPLF